MGTSKKLLLKMLASAVQWIKLSEGASLAVPLLSCDTDFSCDLRLFVFFFLYEPLFLNSVEIGNAPIQ